ncbi:hypothetical protein AO368_0090 [Moraxella catarrhalis]|nr:hypothetical protein AO376_0268 [Moraxella catarrhalis]OAV16927.1 hypothetical protein AO374_1462 [Moraxella catarrhalis]OAV33545.1 hypothetical protein AO368_0090 [Moraxella catarrhalis]
MPNHKKLNPSIIALIISIAMGLTGFYQLINENLSNTIVAISVFFKN